MFNFYFSFLTKCNKTHFICYLFIISEVIASSNGKTITEISHFSYL